MMLNKLHIENYKSLKKVDIELNEDLNIFIGKNNSGKSNIIDALMFLSELAINSRADNVLGKRGGYKEIVFGKDDENEIVFDLEFFISEEEMIELFSKLQLKPEISLEDFKEFMLNKIKYAVKLGGKHYTLLQEELYIHANDDEILYAKGFYNERGIYEYSLLESFKEGITNKSWNLISRGGGSSSPESILHRPTSHTPIEPEENLLLLFHDFFSSFKKLNPVRNAQGSMSVRGGTELNPDGSNLPQVLNSIASGNRTLFDTIMKSAGEIIEEISEIRAPLKDSSSETYLSTVESSFEDVEFTWDQLSSGTKEILYLITLLHVTTPERSLLMIEEPEIHLHLDATYKFLSLVEKICEENHKQVLMTTHSPMLVDAVSFDEMHIAAKKNGKTNVESFNKFADIEKKLVKQGILKSWLLLPQAKQLPFAKFILVTEGRDDIKIWKKFIEKSDYFSDPEEIKVIRGGNEEDTGSWTEAIKTGRLLRLLCDIGISSLPFMVVLDSDNNESEKKEKLGQAKLSTDDYHILQKKEIEDYLLDPVAISKVTRGSIDEVNEAINNSKGGGKEKLNKIFESFGLSKPDTGVKELLAANVGTIPEEISDIINKIRDTINE